MTKATEISAEEVKEKGVAAPTATPQKMDEIAEVTSNQPQHPSSHDLTRGSTGNQERLRWITRRMGMLFKSRIAGRIADGVAYMAAFTGNCLKPASAAWLLLLLLGAIAAIFSANSKK